MLNSAFDSPNKARVRVAPTVAASETAMTVAASGTSTETGISKQTLGIATVLGLSALGLLVLKPKPVPPVRTPTSPSHAT